MNTTYTLETIARQRLDEAARQARTAAQPRATKVRVSRQFPKLTWQGRYGSFRPRPA
jgi:hypothetical protein